MRPLRITIEGLRSFRAEVGIDFGDRTQIAVIGDTGAGKSSILEAMTYALYGQTSLGGRSKQELMNDTSDVMRVVLRFQVAGEEWEVTRVDRRSARAGGLGPAKAQLVCYGPSGETIKKVEQVRLVNERVRALIGLDSDAFLRTVILPQGRFARLLVEDAPSARTEILRQVWRTQDLEAAGELTAQRLHEVRTLAVRLRDEMERHPDDPEEHLELLTSQADEAGRKADALAELRDRSTRVRQTIRESETTRATARRASERVVPSAMDELIGRLVPMESAQRRIQTEATELEERKVGLERELNGIPTDDGPDHHEIAHTLAALGAIPNEVAKAVDAARALRRALAYQAEAEEQHTQAQQALESARDRLTRYQALEPPLAEGVDAARERMAKAKRWYGKCHDLQERIRSTEDALAELRREMAELTTRLATAKRDWEEAQEGLRRAERELSEAQRTNAAAAAAHGLCPGDECPVCESDLPQGWTPPQDTGLDAAHEAHQAAKSRADGARRVVTDLEAEKKSGQKREEDIRRELDDLRSEYSGALDHLRNATGLDDLLPLAGDAPFPSREEALAPVQRQLDEAEAKLREHHTEGGTLREARTSAQVAEAAARQTLNHARNEIERTGNAADEALHALNRNIHSIILPFRPHLVLPSDAVELETVDTAPVDRALYAARERGEILRRREQERVRLRSEMEEARTALERLGEACKTQVEEPLQAIVRELAEQRTVLGDAVRELDADIVIPAAIHYPVDAETLREGIGQHRVAMADMVARAGDLLGRALVDADEARGEAREVAERLDPPADPTDLDVLVQSAGQAANEAGYAARVAMEARDAFAAILDKLLKLKQTTDEVSALELALGDLDAALKPGAFLKWLTQRRSRDLLVYASKILEEMTSGRYSFADPGDLEDQQWRVVDNDSGQARSPASLSGGEQFIGSLALALGMVEMMARSGGRLESLFLDEGFGSLDRHNLDSSIEALSMVARRGRMVGVISHVAAVAEQIDDVLAVTRRATGSQVTWLSRAQRQELARSEAGLAGASALAGLLE